MSKAKAPPKNKKWLNIGLLVLAGVVLYVGIYMVLAPRLQDWFLSRFPEMAAVQKALKQEFPKRQIGMSDNTAYGDEKVRTLLVVLAGNNYLEPSEEQHARATICRALGPNASHYQRLVLQNTVQHRFLLFYSTQSRTSTFRCAAQ